MGSWHRPLHLRHMHAAVGKESTLDKARYDVLSLPGYVIEKNPTHAGPSMRQCMYYKAHETVKQARKHKHGYKNILYRWNDKYRKSLSDIVWIEGGKIKYDEIALEDHSDVATREERSRNEKSWTLSIECRGCTRTNESAQFLQRGEADMQKTVPGAHSDHWKWKQTYPSSATSPTKVRSTF